MNYRLNDLGDHGPDRPSLVYLRISKEGQVQRAVAYLRMLNEGAEHTVTLVAQQNTVQQFADYAGYEVVPWYEDGPGVELEGSVLDRLLEDVVPEGREFNAVLVWNWSRLSLDRVRLVQIERTLRAHGVDLVSVTESPRLEDWERQLAE